MPEQKFFELDKDSLDVEWINQPKLYYQYAVELANARERFEQKKAKLDLVEAELSLQIRDNPDQFQLVKLTEGAINATMLAQDTYKSALKSLHKAKHKVDSLQAAVVALDHRKKALENLVQLWMANYFSSPQVKGDSKEHVDKAQRKRAFKPIEKEADTE